VLWQKVYSPKNSARHFSEDHDYVVVYAKNANVWKPNLVPRSEDQDAAYKNRDNDPRGPWKTSDLSARNYYSGGMYAVTSPSGRLIEGPPTGRYWTISKEKFEAFGKGKRIWWGNKGDSIPQLKRFLSDVKQGVVPQTMWFYKDVGHTQDAKKELVSVMDFADSDSVFITPKPTKLIERILQIATNPGDLILDSFAGSGTTGHAVLKMNAARVASEVEVDAASPPHMAATSSQDSRCGGDAAATERTYFDPAQPVGFLRGGSLPHWRQEGTTYFVTWRTADSMPAGRVRQWVSERDAWLKSHPSPYDLPTRAEYDRLFPERWEHWLDECHGACELLRPEIKAVVEQALRCFDGVRYRLDELAVMPNHVHVLVTPLGEHTLSEIVQNWKSYTAHAINKQFGHKGEFWQKESFDHIVRHADDMERFRAYIRAQQVDAASPPRTVESEASPPRTVESEASPTRHSCGGDAASTLRPMRRFILVEMEPKIAREVTAERVRRVAQGYANAKGEAVAGLGGGFRYCELGEPLFDETGMIRASVKFSELARHVYFSETGEPLPRARVLNTPFLGACRGVGIYLLYNGILGDETANGGNVLTRQTLARLPPFEGPKVVYCAGCLLSRDRLQGARITVRQTPYEIKVS